MHLFSVKIYKIWVWLNKWSFLCDEGTSRCQPPLPQTMIQFVVGRWPESITIILLSGGWSCILRSVRLDQACRSILPFQYQCLPFHFSYCVQLTIQMAGGRFRFLPVNPETRKLQSVSIKRIRAATINPVSVSLMGRQHYQHWYVKCFSSYFCVKARWGVITAQV